jgi:hypothetical protein
MVLARIPPVAAWDAVGRPVKTTSEVSGNLLRIHVMHRSARPAYPVLVDPAVIEDFRNWRTNSSLDFNGWSFDSDSSPSPKFTPFYGNSTYGNGLYMYNQKAGTYTAGQARRWFFNVLGFGSAYIYRADFTNIYHYVGTGNGTKECTLEGLYNRDGSGNYSGGKTATQCTAVTTYPSVTVCARTDCSAPGGGMTSAVFGSTIQTSGALGLFTNYLGGAAIYEYDTASPVMTQTAIPTGWVMSASGMTVQGTETGMGMVSVVLDSPTDTNWDQRQTKSFAPCGDRNHRCPRIVQPNSFGSGNLADGIATIRAVGTAATGESTTGTWPLKLDTKPPVLSDSGPLSEVGAVGGNSTAFDVTALDSAPGITTSGVRSIELSIDGSDPQGRYLWNAPSCPSGSCDQHHGFTVDLTSLSTGTHTLGIVAIDYAGNVASDDFQFTYVPGPPVVTRRGPAAPSGAVLPPVGRSLTVSATEQNSGQPDFGIRSAKLSIDGSEFRTSEEPCGSGGACDLTDSFDLDSANLGDGVHGLQLDVTDLAGNVTTQTWSVTADNTDPGIADSGSLKDAANHDTNGETYDLNVDATDSLSGVASIEILVDGTRAGYQEQSCSGGCSLSYHFTYVPSNYSSDSHSIAVIVTDAAGNVGIDVFVVNNQSDDDVDSSKCPRGPPPQVLGGTLVTSDQALELLQQYQPAVVAPATAGSGAAQHIAPTLSGLGGVGIGLNYVGRSVATPVVVAGIPADGFGVGFPADPVCLTPTAVGAVAGLPRLVSNDAVLTANFLPSTDLVQRATGIGAKAILQLRDDSAPRDFSWTVNLGSSDELTALGGNVLAVVHHYATPSAEPQDSSGPSDSSPPPESSDNDPNGYQPFPPPPPEPEPTDQAVTPDTPPPGSSSDGPADTANTDVQLAVGSAEYNSAVQRSNGYVRAIIRAPWAVDATGARIPITLSTQGSTVTLHVAHTTASSYPLIVDPGTTAPPPAGDSRNKTEMSKSGEKQHYFPTGGVCQVSTFAIGVSSTASLNARGTIDCEAAQGGELEPIRTIVIKDRRICARKLGGSDSEFHDYRCSLPTLDSPQGLALSYRLFLDEPCFAATHTYQARVTFELHANTASGTFDTKILNAQDGSRRTDCTESDLWTREANAVRGKPSTALRDALLAQTAEHNRQTPDYYESTGSLKGFATHHIIPIAAKGAKEARALGYRCGVGPNSWENGVFLRDKYRKRQTDPGGTHDTIGFKELTSPADKKRQYHPSLHTTAYYNWVASKLSGAIRSNGSCNTSTNAADQSSVGGVLEYLRTELKNDRADR